MILYPWVVMLLVRSKWWFWSYWVWSLQDQRLSCNLLTLMLLFINALSGWRCLAGIWLFFCSYIYY